MEVIDNVIRAYEAVKLNDVSKGIIALCTFVAVIIVIQKFVTAWKEAFSEGEKPADMKHFFRLFYIYIYVFAVIMAAPFAFTIVEKALHRAQKERGVQVTVCTLNILDSDLILVLFYVRSESFIFN